MHGKVGLKRFPSIALCTPTFISKKNMTNDQATGKCPVEVRGVKILFSVASFQERLTGNRDMSNVDFWKNGSSSVRLIRHILLFSL